MEPPQGALRWRDTMTKLYQPAQSIEATIGDKGEPLAFEWREQVHHVLHVNNHWRIHVEWWRTEIWREYFQTETLSRLTCVIYRDLLTDTWYLERIYD
jgi:hypothetical protein